MNILHDMIPTQKSYVDLVEIDDARVLHNIISGIIYDVNKVGALVWLLCDGQNTVGDILKEVSEIFTCNETNISQDVSDLLNLFQRLDLLSIEDSNKQPKPKVLLINPPYPHPNERYRKINIVPPLGICYVASVLREENYCVKIVDMLVEDMRPMGVKNVINEFMPDFIGISANFACTYDVCLEIAQTIKTITSVPVILGGNHVTYIYEDVLENHAVDYVARFQGEYTLLELLDILTRRNPKKMSECLGIAYKEQEKIVTTDRREFIDNLDVLPIPAWDLLPMHKYSEEGKWHIITTRGCTHSCIFVQQHHSIKVKELPR